ncbi:MAG: hypothetical protein JXX28_07840 [Deltaproteobacteria bacterium]|nr:hypothetical protein [Deltaproteobacteria bacterium]
MWILWLLACQQPFGIDRHDLEGTRVAALRARTTSEGGVPVVHPEAVFVQGGRLWADEAPAMVWGWVETPDALGALGAGWEGDVQGPAPALPLDEDAGWIGLIASTADGAISRAALRYPVEARPELGPIAVSRVDDLTLSTLEAADLEAEARGAWAVTPEGPLQPGDIALLGASLAEGQWTRWMALDGAGTFAELDAERSHWIAGEVDLDAIDTATRSPVDPGVVSFLTLALDPSGGSDFALWDLAVGDAPTGLFTATGRFLATDTQVSGPWVSGTLVADDTAHSGLRLEGTAHAAPPDPVQLPPCAPTGATSFDPNWLATARCTRAELIGASVWVETR